VYVGNRSPTKALKDCTPYEALYGARPNVSHLRTFGCVAYRHIPGEMRQKLDDTAEVCRFIGYSEESKGWLLWSPKSNRVSPERNVVFDEGKFHLPAGAGSSAAEEEDGWAVVLNELSGGQPIFSARREETRGGETETDDEEEVRETLLTPGQRGPRPMVEDGEPGQTSATGSGGDGVTGEERREEPAPLRRSDRIKERRQRMEAESEGANMAEIESANAAETTNQEPNTLAEAREGPDAVQWELTVVEEMEALKRNRTWDLDLVELPRGRKPVGCRWIFRIKQKADGTVERYKARLVARGFSQQYGIDFEETFAPVARISSVRLILAIAVANNYEIHQMDVTAAYLNGRLEEEIYLQQPEGFEDKNNPDGVYRLRRALYGLKQAGRTWYKTLRETLTDQLGFQQAHWDHSVYTRMAGDEMVILIVYVDDLLVIGRDMRSVGAVKKELAEHYEMKDLGEADSFLGMSIRRNRKEGTMTLTQGGFAKSVLERFGMTEARSVATPVDPNTTLSKIPEDSEDIDKGEYLRLVGSLMYLSIATRPDLAFAVGYLGRFGASPKAIHSAAGKRALRYLARTINHGLVFRRGGEPKIVGYSDADWAGDVDERKSTTGYAFKLAGGAVSWYSKKQGGVSSSTIEAELVAASTAAKEAIWLKNLAKFVGWQDDSAMTLNIDNQGVLAIIKNPTFHAKTKHIDVHNFYVRERAEEHVIEPVYIASNANVADIFTKGLHRPSFRAHLKDLGVADASWSGSVEGK
jgi:hypothetical protein